MMHKKDMIFLSILIAYTLYVSDNTTPIIPVRLELRPLASALGLYPSSSAAFSTFSLVLWLILSFHFSLKTLDTEDWDTPALFATSNEEMLFIILLSII